MKSAFRVGSPTGTTGAQQIYLSSIAGHPGTVQNFYYDMQLGLRNAAAAASGSNIRSGRGPIFSAKLVGAAQTNVQTFPEQTASAALGDDIDNILNALYGTTQVQIFNLGVGRIIFDQLNMVQLRTLFGFLNGGQDITSRNLIDYPIDYPTSAGGAQTYNIGMIIPISLSDYIAGGEVFAQGTDSMRDGSFQLNFAGAASFVTSGVGTATINFVSTVYTLYANYLWEGDGSWVGPTWRATRQAYGGNNPMLKPGHYLWASDSSTQTGNGLGQAGFNACTVTQYNFHGQYNGDQVSPAALRMDWAINRGSRFGTNFLDVGERTVPIITVDPTDTVRRLPLAKMAQTIDASSGTVTNIVLLLVEAIEKNPGIVSSVAAIKGGGGPVTAAHPDVLTHEDQSNIHPSVLPFIPTVQVAGSVPGGQVASGPTQAGTHTATHNLGGLAKAAQRRQGR